MHVFSDCCFLSQTLVFVRLYYTERVQKEVKQMKNSIRILAVLLITMLVFSSAMPAYAQVAEPSESRAIANVTCGFTKKTGNNYQFWGKLYYIENANLSINVFLYSSSGLFLSSCTNAGTGTSISARKTVSLFSGTYIVKAYGYANGTFIGYNETSISIP